MKFIRVNYKMCLLLSRARQAAKLWSLCFAAGASGVQRFTNPWSETHLENMSASMLTGMGLRDRQTGHGRFTPLSYTFDPSAIGERSRLNVVPHLGSKFRHCAGDFKPRRRICAVAERVHPGEPAPALQVGFQQVHGLQDLTTRGRVRAASDARVLGSIVVHEVN